MEKSIDKRGELNDDVFAYKITKDRKVLISWHGKQVTILSGNKAEDFITDINETDGKDAQLIMAKFTGNFKHGNEKTNKRLR